MARRFDPVLLDAFLAEARVILASADEAIQVASQQPSPQAKLRLEATLGDVDQLRQSAVFLKAEAVVAATTAVQVALRDHVRGVTWAEPAGLEQLRVDLRSLSELIQDLATAPRRQPRCAAPASRRDEPAPTSGPQEAAGDSPAPDGRANDRPTSDSDLLDQIARAAGLDGGPADEATAPVNFDEVFAEALAQLDGECQDPPGSEADAEAPAPEVPPGGRSAEPASSGPEPVSEANSSNEPVGDQPAAIADGTVRIGSDRLADLVDLAGQLVLCKNRVVMLTGENRAAPSPALGQQLQAAATELDRVSGLLQVAVMRTQLEPISRVLDQASTVVARLAGPAGREMAVTIEGGDIEVDRRLIHSLSRPFMNLLSVIALRSIESTADREAGGKPARATVDLVATQQGSQVAIRLRDDGAGIGGPHTVRVTSQADLAALAGEDRDALTPVVCELAEQGARFELISRPGVGVTCEIALPLNTAIMQAMMIRCGDNVYALPLNSLLEVARPEPDQLSTVRGAPMLTLRGAVYAVVDLREELGEVGEGRGEVCVAMIEVNQVVVALVIDEALGQRDVVIKPLEHPCTMRGPFSGATIRDDGAVSLILDPLKLLARHVAPRRVAA